MEDQDQIQEVFIPYTYTYDQFTVFFYGDRVFVGDKSFPIGQCTVDMMNLGEGIWDEIDRRVQQFLPAAQQLLSKKSRQRRSFRARKTERCLGCHIYFTGLSGPEDRRGMQLPCSGEPFDRGGQMDTDPGARYRGTHHVSGIFGRVISSY